MTSCVALPKSISCTATNEARGVGSRYPITVINFLYIFELCFLLIYSFVMFPRHILEKISPKGGILE